MRDDGISLADIVLKPRPRLAPIAFHDRQYVNAEDFYAAVRYWAMFLQSQPFQRYGLFTENAYPFAVLLYGLLHAGKEVWIASNNRPGTAEHLQHQGCQLLGNWDAELAFDFHLNSSNEINLPLQAINPSAAKLVMYTSGSTGKPKAIVKNLLQLQAEIATLEQLWGQPLSDSEIVSTVSHQHIYGLLFKILWPLSTGRCFHSPIYLNPEILTHSINSRPACWVASPAHLKRLDHDSPWAAIKEMAVIFSSGGALPLEAKQQIQTCSGQSVLEIYGSTETGGIGWRQQDTVWTLFPGMTLTAVDNRWRLNSPYLLDKADCLLDDELKLVDENRFILQGRVDRIAKIEEKRLSLTELEQHLSEHEFVSEGFALVLHNGRDVVAIAAALSQEGWDYLVAEGRVSLIQCLRKFLEHWFESVTLPRKWFFINTMPLTTQGKIDQDLLKSLWQNNGKKLPNIHTLKLTDNQVELRLTVPKGEDLAYFPDHFPGYPILPGVVQLAWVEHYGKLFWDLRDSVRPFSHLEVVKFAQVITPGNELTLSLNWKADSGELCFNFSSDSGICSSGRMVYTPINIKACLESSK